MSTHAFWPITNTMTTYPPKTILRLYDADKTTHCTAVVTKFGTVFEIKTSAGKTGREYTSVEDWTTTRNMGGELTIDTAKADFFFVPPDTKGFKYPRKRSDNCFAAWLYEIMVEGAPHLLDNPAVRDAYNTFVDTCAEFKHLYCQPGHMYSGRLRYDAYGLFEYPTEYGIMYGYLHIHDWELAKATGGKIQNALNPLYDLVKKDVLAFLAAKRKEIKDAKEIKELNRSMNVIKRRIVRYQNMISCETTRLNRLTEKLNKLTMTK